MSGPLSSPFRCGKFVCVGRNYLAHVKELKNSAPTKPFFFIKPSTAILPFNPSTTFSPSSPPILIPPTCSNLHHEVELGVVIGRRATDVDEKDADSFISGYVLALDMTGRDLQDAAKNAGLPWTFGKACDTWCPVSPFLPSALIRNYNDVEIWCEVNGKPRQRCSTSQMVFKFPTLLSHITQHITLEEGDIVLTGTPEGVGAVKDGDVISAGITGIPLSNIKFNVKNKNIKAKM